MISSYVVDMANPDKVSAVIGVYSRMRVKAFQAVLDIARSDMTVRL